MSLTALFDIHAVVAELSGHDVDAVFAELATPIARASGVSVSELVRVVREREALGSTAVGDRVAIPHGVHPGLDRIVASFGRSRTGIAMDAPDGQQVQLFVMLVRPPDGAASHLKTLARVSQLLGNPDTRAALLGASDAAAIHDILVARSR